MFSGCYLEAAARFPKSPFAIWRKKRSGRETLHSWQVQQKEAKQGVEGSLQVWWEMPQPVHGHVGVEPGNEINLGSSSVCGTHPTSASCNGPYVLEDEGQLPELVQGSQRRSSKADTPSSGSQGPVTGTSSGFVFTMCREREKGSIALKLLTLPWNTSQIVLALAMNPHHTEDRRSWLTCPPSLKVREICIGLPGAVGVTVAAGKLRLCCQTSMRWDDLARTPIGHLEWVRPKIVGLRSLLLHEVLDLKARSFAMLDLAYVLSHEIIPWEELLPVQAANSTGLNEVQNPEHRWLIFINKLRTCGIDFVDPPWKIN